MCDAHARPDDRVHPESSIALPKAGLSRRSMLRAGALGLGGAAALGMAGGLALPAWAADERPAGALADGAPTGDPAFAEKFATAQAKSQTAQSRTMAGTMAQTSYNDWPVGTPGSTIGIRTFPIAGTNVRLELVGGDAGTILAYVARRFNTEVEGLDRYQCGGYEYRRNVNNPSVWSNHASGTAMDLNWSRHPNGARGTFSSGQVGAIRNILAACNGTVYWGGDYRGTTDEMHFEINVSPGDPSLAATVARINGYGSPSRTVALRARANNQIVSAEAAGGRPLIANRSSAQQWERFDVFSMGGNLIALRSQANGNFVCADGGGNAPLVANRSSPSTWETFALQRNGDGSTALLALANGLYVCADAAGGAPLIANRTSVDTWESFVLTNV